MSLNIRMLAPVAVSAQSMNVNGRAYSATPGSYLDVPDCDANVLAANGWVRVAPSGPTSSRPSTNYLTNPPYLAAPSVQYFDTTISKLIVFNGSSWIDPATGGAV